VNRSSRLLPALLTILVAAPVVGCSGAPVELATLHIDPTPAPTPKPPTKGELAAKAFFERVASGKLTYHASLQGELAGAISGVKLDGGIDVAGDDYNEVVSYSFLEPPPIAVSVRSVGTKRWLKVGKAAWQKVSSSMALNTPFADLSTPDSVQLVRTEHVGARDLHHLVMTGGLIIAPDLIPAGNVTNEKVDKTTLELVIDDNGQPISATWRLDGEARVSGQLQGIRVDLDMAFTNVGSKLTIKAP
jgi:hypothetical protein